MLIDTIIKGVALLKREKHYNQITLVNKLRNLGIELSEPLFSNIINGKKVGSGSLNKISEGIQQIIRSELGLHWSSGRYAKIKDYISWTPTVVPELSLKNPSVILKPGFAFHDGGRLAIQDKIALLLEAQKEVIEFGLTLNTYTTNFVSRSDPEFKSPVEKLLEKGVDFKCYVIGPDCNEARIYFADRLRVQEEEKGRLEKIRDTITKLRRLEDEFKEANYKGTFQIYSYKHIPYNYFMVIDGAYLNGKMIVSHYIYGEPRAKCPVIELSKNINTNLFKKYWSSLKKLTKNARRVQ